MAPGADGKTVSRSLSSNSKKKVCVNSDNNHHLRRHQLLQTCFFSIVH